MDAKCPSCDAGVKVPENVEQNEILVCEDCGLELEVTKVSPLKLEEAPEEDEAWGE